MDIVFQKRNFRTKLNTFRMRHFINFWNLLGQKIRFGAFLFLIKSQDVFNMGKREAFLNVFLCVLILLKMDLTLGELFKINDKTCKCKMLNLIL